MRWQSLDALLASTSPSSALPANDEDRDDKDEESMDDVPTLTALDFIRDYLPAIDDARQTVTDMMEDMVVRGLRDLVSSPCLLSGSRPRSTPDLHCATIVQSPTLLSASLQTAYNLGSLPDLVRDLLADLTDVIRERIRAAFDMASLGRELGLKGITLRPSPGVRLHTA